MRKRDIRGSNSQKRPYARLTYVPRQTEVYTAATGPLRLREAEARRLNAILFNFRTQSGHAYSVSMDRHLRTSPAISAMLTLVLPVCSWVAQTIMAFPRSGTDSQRIRSRQALSRLYLHV